MSASENGWQPGWVDQNSLEWVVVPGTSVNLQIMKGQPAKIMAAFAADFNAYVEPLRDNDSACYTATNSVSTSNHLNGTAMDLNWDSHAFHVKGTFNQGQMATIRELLKFYEDTIYWGGDWTSPIDEMHWQMGYGSVGNPATASFINRKIRSDGYSTFRRGPITAKPKDEPVPSTGGILMSLTDAEQREMLELLRQQSGYRRVSRSPLRRLGEGETQTVTGFEWNTDGSVHVLLEFLLAVLGDPDTTTQLQELASADPARYPDRAHDRLLAQAILNYVAAVGSVGSAPATGATPGLVLAPPVVPAPVAEPVPVVAARPVEAQPGGGVQSQLDALSAEITALRSVLSGLGDQMRS